MSLKNLNELKLKLGRILTGLEQHTDNPPATKVPEKERKEGLEIIGVVNDPMARSLHSFFRSLTEYVDDYIAAHSLTEEEAVKKMTLEMFEAHTIHVKIVREFAGMVKDLFWLSVGQEIPEVATDKREYGIYEGWQISARKVCNCPVCQMMGRSDGRELGGIAVVEVIGRRQESD